MVEDDEGAGRPQHCKNGRDSEEDGGGFAGGVTTEAKTVAAST